MKDRWLLVTAGFSAELEGAADRVEKQALDFQLFDTLVIDKDNLPTFCPEYVQKYQNFLTPDVPGYGHFGWKPAIIDSLLNSDLTKSKYSGLIWVDAGCEMFPSPWTRLRLKTWMQLATRSGFWGFSLDTPERIYTKKKLFNHFPLVLDSDNSPQIQATFLLLYGSKGRQIAAKWNEIAMDDIANLDFSKSNQGEDFDFIQHRSDQSILSLTIKSMGFQPSHVKPRPGQSGLRAVISASVHPIWTSRNRTSLTIVPIFLRFLGLLSLKLTYPSSLLNNERFKRALSINTVQK